MADLLFEQTVATTKAVNDLAAAFKNVRTGLPALNRTAKSSLEELRTLTAGFDSMKKDIQGALLGINQTLGALPMEIARALADAKVVTRVAGKQMGDGLVQGIEGATAKARSTVRGQIKQLQLDYETGAKATAASLAGLKLTGVSLFPADREVAASTALTQGFYNRMYQYKVAAAKKADNEIASFEQSVQRDTQGTFNRMYQYKVSEAKKAANEITAFDNSVQRDTQGTFNRMYQYKVSEAKKAANEITAFDNSVQRDTQGTFNRMYQYKVSEAKRAANEITAFDNSVLRDTQGTFNRMYQYKVSEAKKAANEITAFDNSVQRDTQGTFNRMYQYKVSEAKKAEGAIASFMKGVEAETQSTYNRIYRYKVSEARKAAAEALAAEKTAIREAAKAQRDAILEADNLAKRLNSERMLAMAPARARGNQETSLAGKAIQEGSYSTYAPLTKAHGELNNLLKIGKKETADFSGALRLFSADANDAHSAVRGLASGFGAMFLTWGKLLPLLAGAAISNGFVQTIKLGAEVAQQLDVMRVLSGETEQSIANLETSMISLGKSKYSIEDVAGAMKLLSLAGLDAAEVGSSIKDVLNFATAGDTDLKTAADVISSVATAFKYTADQYNIVGDVIAKTAAVSKASVESIGEAFKTSSVLAQQYGVSLNDVGVGIAALANLGIQGSAAGTALRNMYNDLSGRSKEVRALMKDLGLEVRNSVTGSFASIVSLTQQVQEALDKAGTALEKKNIMQKLLSERGAKPIIELLALIEQKAKETGTNAANELMRLQEEIANSAGFAASAAAELSLTAEAQMKSVFNTMKASAYEAFQEIEPLILGVSASLRDAFDSPEFKESLQTLVIQMARLTTVLVENIDLIVKFGAGLAAFMGLKAVIGIFSTLVGWWDKLFIAGRGLLGLFSGLGGGAAAAAAGTTGAAVASRGLLALLGPVGIAIGAAATAWQAYKFFTDEAGGSTDKYSGIQSVNLIAALKKEREQIELKTQALKENKTVQDLVKEKGFAEVQRGDTAAFNAELKRLGDEYVRLDKLADERMRKTGYAEKEVYQLNQVKGAIAGLIQKRNEHVKGVEAEGVAMKASSKAYAEAVEAARKEAVKPPTLLGTYKPDGGDTPEAKAKRKKEEAAARKAVADAERAELRRTNREWSEASQSRADNTMQIFEKMHADRLAKLKEVSDNEIKLIDAREKAGLKSTLEAGFERIAAVERTEAAVLREMEEGIAAQKANFAKIKGSFNLTVDSPQDYETRVENAGRALDAFVEKNRNAAIAIKDNAFTRLTLAAISAQGEIKKLDEGFRKYWEDVAREEQAENERAQNEISNLGLSERQLTIKNAAYSAQAKALGELRKAQDEYNNANKELEAFYARLNASAATGPYTQEQQDLIDAAATKVERLGTQVERLGDLYAGAGAKAGKTAAELYDATQNQIFVNGIAEAVTTGLFEGGKSGSKKLRDVITAELRKPITIFVNAIVNSLMQGSGLGGAGGLIQSVAASFVAGNSSNGGGPTGELAKTAVGIGYNSVTGQGYSKALVVAIEKIGSTLTTTTIPALQEFGVTLLGNSINIAEWVAANGSAIMGYINAFMALLNKEYGKAIGTAIGTYIGSLWGPIGAAIGSVVGSLIGGWIDKYFGGGGGPKTESHFGPGVSTHGGPDFAKQISDTIEVSYAAFATSLGLAVKELEVGVHTSIDTLGDAMTILEVTAFSEGKKIYDRIDRVKNRENVGRNPEDLNKAIQEEMSFVLLAALKNSDLPGQFKEYLQKATNLEEAAKILEPLIKLREQFNTLSVVFEQLNSATLNSQVSLVEMNGTFDDLTSKLSKYFENYYSEAEKFSSISDTVSRALSQVGLTMPDIAQGSESARAAFRSMVEAQDLNTESGRATYTVLLSVADSFAQLTPKAEAATSAVVETVAAINQQAEAMKSQALALEEQIFQLENAGNTAALRERELATIPEANKALQQRIYALQDESAAAQLAADKTKALADETARLETELFNASATAAQIRDRELSGLNEANRVTQLRIYALQDEKTANELATAAIEKAAAAAEATMQQRLGLENELLQLQGNTTELRRRELNAITDLNNKGIQQSIWALQDMQAAAESSSRAMEEAAQKQAAITAQRLQLENQILQMEGNTTELRARELAGIDDGHNKSLQQYIWAMEDQKVANEQAAQAAQQTAQANQQAAQAANESASAISNAAQEMANAARQAADAMASEFDGLYRQALTLSGNTAALRAMDLEKLHPANRALQEQIWALEDQKAALDKATESQQSYSNSVSDTADFLKGISKNVKEYFDGLRVNDGGLGSPALQAQHARAQYEEQLTLAKGGNRDALSSITTYADNLIKTRTAISRDGSDVKVLIAQLEKQLTELPTMVSAEEMIVNAINNSTTTTTQTATALNLDAINAAIAAAREQVDAANAAAGAVVQAQQTGSTAQVQAANTTTAALNTTNMTLAQFQQKLVVEMTATAQSAISKLITYATNTDNLPADLKYLALAESLPLLQRTVNLIQDSNMNPETKFLALKTADTLTRTVDAIFSSTLSEEVRMLALKTNDSITRVVGATLNPNVTEEVKTLALKASDGFTRTITAVLSASTTDETRVLALKTNDGFIRTISAVLSADMAQETKQLALKTSDGFTRTVSAVLASGVTDETKQLALKASDGFTRIVSAVQAAGISDETRQLALKGSDAITRTITAVLGSGTTDLIKQLALQSSDEITRVITVVLGAGTSEDTRQLALKTNDSFTRTINAVLASTVNDETKTLALKSNDGFIRTVSAVLASGVSEEAKQVMLKGSDNFTRTVTAIISSGQSDEAKQLALKGNDSFVRTFNAVLGSADSTALSLLNALSSSITKTVQTVMGSSDPQAVQLAQLGTSYITKYISSAMGSNDPQALSLALKNSEAITKTINTIVQSGSITADQLNLIKLLNGDVYDNHVIQAAIALEASSGFNSALSSSIASALNQSLAGMFTTLDTSVNGLLDRAELQAALGPLATNAMLDSVYRTLDADGDGQISRLEAIKGSAAWTADTNNWIGTTNAEAINKLLHLGNLNANQVEWLRQNYLTGQWIAEEAHGTKLASNTTASSNEAIKSNTGLTLTESSRISAANSTYLPGIATSTWWAETILRDWYNGYHALKVSSWNRDPGAGQVFAAGGAFTNSVVRKPTSFNMGLMGEAGAEGILPLANVGGVLGVHAGGMSGRDDGYDFELLQELRALRAEVADLRRETRSVSSNTAKSAKTLERLDRDGVAERVE